MRPDSLSSSVRQNSLEVRTWLPVIVAASFVFFARSYTNYFVADDYEFLGRIDFSAARQYFTKSWGYGNEYRPLLVYSYALDRALSGQNPIGYHITNTALHIANALMVGRLGRVCGVPPEGGLLASLIFLVNPVSHESVLWIAGRPVVLSAFLVLLSIYSFLKATWSRQSSSRWSVLMYISFAAGVLTYEGAVVMPFLAVLLSRRLMGSHRHRGSVHLAILLFLLAAYAGAWNWFFGFRITRFPMESSLLSAAGSLGRGITHALHGSLRPLIAPAYLAILAATLGQQESRKLAVLAPGWFLISYLPFFIVQGYADRFAYLSSAGTSFLLATGLVTLGKTRFKIPGLLITMGLITFYAIGMQNRISMWKEAGSIAFRIPREVKALMPHLNSGTTLVLLNVPDMYKHALVYLTGLERAIALQYPGVKFQLKRRLEAQMPDGAAVFEYSNGHVQHAGHVYPAQKKRKTVSSADISGHLRTSGLIGQSWKFAAWVVGVPISLPSCCLRVPQPWLPWVRQRSGQTQRCAPECLQRAWFPKQAASDYQQIANRRREPVAAEETRITRQRGRRPPTRRLESSNEPHFRAPAEGLKPGQFSPFPGRNFLPTCVAAHPRVRAPA